MVTSTTSSSRLAIVVCLTQGATAWQLTTQPTAAHSVASSRRACAFNQMPNMGKLGSDFMGKLGLGDNAGLSEEARKRISIQDCRLAFPATVLLLPLCFSCRVYCCYCCSCRHRRREVTGIDMRHRNPSRWKRGFAPAR